MFFIHNKITDIYGYLVVIFCNDAQYHLNL